jgi:endonuclease
VKSIYESSTRELMKKFIYSENIQKGEKFNRERIRKWFNIEYPKIKPATIDAHITFMSVNSPSRIHHIIHPDGSDDLFIQLDDGTLRLYDKNNDPAPIYKNIDAVINDEASEEENLYEEGKEFAYESDLKNFLSKNLNIIEKGLTLYEEEGITGIEYDAGGRFIDILAVDKNKNFVVIELKVSKGYDRVVGQILRYIGWIKSNLAEKNQKVRGIIIARTISDDLKIACAETENIKLYEYNLSVSLKTL